MLSPWIYLNVRLAIYSYATSLTVIILRRRDGMFPVDAFLQPESHIRAVPPSPQVRYRERIVGRSSPPRVQAIDRVEGR